MKKLATLFALAWIAAVGVVFSQQANPLPCCGQQLVQAKQQPPRTVKSPTGKIHFTGRVAPTKTALQAMVAEAHARHGAIVSKLAKATAPTFDCRALGWVPPIRDQGQCVPGATMVLMGDRTQKPIEQVKVGDIIMTDVDHCAAVVQVFKRKVVERLWEIRAGDKVLRATANHPVFTRRGFKVIASIGIGDEVLINTGAEDQFCWVAVKQVLWREGVFSGAVYNLRTAGAEVFIANGIVVHNCGSCWCFSGSGVVTSALIKAGQIPNSANGCSEQYTLDCAQNGGCNGDDNTTVLTWAKATGLPLDKDYGVPYQASSGKCQYTSSMKLYKLADFGFCTPASSDGVANTQDIKNAMAAYGPIGAGIDASGLGDGQGIISGTGHSIDHDIIIIGWDDSKGKSGCWIMRNSWGTSWGQTCGGTEAGYCYIEYGAWDVGTEAVWATATPVTPPTPPGPPPPWVFAPRGNAPFDTLAEIRQMIDADAAATLAKVHSRLMQQKKVAR